MPTTSDLFRMMAMQNALVNAGGLFSALGTRSLDPAGPSQAMGNFFNQAGVRGQNMLESMLRANEMQARREQEEKRIGLQERQVATGEKAEDRLGRRLEMDEAEQQAAVKRAADIVLQAQNPELARMNPEKYSEEAIKAQFRQPPASKWKNVIYGDGTTDIVDTTDPMAMENVRRRGGQIYGTQYQPSTREDLLRLPTDEGPGVGGTVRPTKEFYGSGQTYEELAAQASGVWEQVGQGINNFLGGVFGTGPMWADTAEAQRQMGLINKAITVGLVENPKYPVAEQQIVQGLLPSPDAWFKGDEQAMRDAGALREHLRLLRDQYVYERDAAPAITPEKRKAAADKVVDLDRFLSMLGDKGQVKSELGTDRMPFRPQSDADWNSIPSGSIYIDPDDGKRYRKP